ncbi:glycyl-tRNA synthetase [Haladaptatus litoreus]|uniref:glycine--tRNA ligase n=1 Tax=Haladaptatus litoreus TaxID=553468 RepID=A0A1N7BS49_9EURY|nr:glycine--tRNA ligase [Haladaptatus litoreus]SIR54034.1 glycyl-tRNA synthetase [Haladaptatus litoreus]
MSDELVELAKRRGFFFQAAEPYGGVSGFYVYGPQGAALKRNIEDSWRDRFQVQEGHREIEAPTIMPEPVFEASGHLDTFDDMLVECPECGESHRADHLIEDNTDIEDAESFPLDEVGDLIADHDLHCPNCDTSLAGEPVEDFNLMFETDIGPGSGQPGYLRPETAQGIFVEFPRLKEYARNQLPFGTTQIGKAYRNEISPRKSIVRVREFTQAELEHFIDPEEDEPPLERVEDVEVRLYSAPKQNADDGDYLDTTIGEAVEEGIIASDWVAYYVGVAQEWYERIGIDMNRFRFRQHLAGERSHYASDCWDAEGEIGGDWIELAGISDRSDYDLSKHGEYSDDDFTVFRQYDEPKVVERATVDPDMSYLGPEFGGAAGDITDALQRLAERNRSAFDSDEVTVEANGESYTIPVEKTGFSVDEVKESGEHITPHVIEPSIGVGRALYTVLVHSYEEDDVEGETRTRLSLEPELAPTTVGVFPLMDKDGMGETAREIATDLRTSGFDVTYDDSGNIGRRYRRQDEVGTPFCVTVDYEGLEDDTVTLRERDSTKQIRVAVADLADILTDLRSGDREFSDL